MSAGQSVNIAEAVHNHTVNNTYILQVDEQVNSMPTQGYLVQRGVVPYQGYLTRPNDPDLSIRGIELISDLRGKLLHRERLPQPLRISVRGTLFPCALLTAGWWERPGKAKITRIEWKDPLQHWLFHGFDLWGPSWDFSWTLDADPTADKPYFIAQLGGGDEADSLPVIIPHTKARKLRELFLDSWGGLEVTVTGLLGHREQFCGAYRELEKFGGLLDYCLWLDDDDKTHKISISAERTELYSGYLWKCIAPRKWLQQKRHLSLDQVYFVFEHVNFAKRDAMNYGLDCLAHKEEYLRSMHGEMVTIQKLSPLVPGDCAWSPQAVYDVFIGKTTQDI
ncbi:MAG: hypothetical protein HY308_03095 [Gammaproteobacteria bacterium]|nr:hypothetical protein [Gammaproteobacteria bacterium]